jgi:hypothetical protein
MVDGSSLECHWLVKIALNSQSEMADTFMLVLLETIPIHGESS